MKYKTTNTKLRLLMIAGALAVVQSVVASEPSLRDILFMAFDRIEIQPQATAKRSVTRRS
jgi:hypothetical protein